MTTAPDFSASTRETLAKRAAQTCSNPDCRAHTSGPHTQDDRAINVGEAAHIRGARLGAARYDPEMTDSERAGPSNGVWLCAKCARMIDRDEQKYTVDLLRRWKDDHEQSVLALRSRDDPAAREIRVKGGGTGSKVENTGDGVALEIVHEGRGPAERIVVEGQGTGQIVTNSGTGIGEKITSTGGGSALETSVVVNGHAKVAAGLHATIVPTRCSQCGCPFTASKVIEAFAGDSEPQTEVNCPHCGASLRI